MKKVQKRKKNISASMKLKY